MSEPELVLVNGSLVYCMVHPTYLGIYNHFGVARSDEILHLTS